MQAETLAQVFSWEFCKTSKNTFFTEHLSPTAYEITTSIKIFHEYLPFPNNSFTWCMILCYHQLYINWTTYFKVVSRVEKTEVLKKIWNFASRTCFASCFIKKAIFFTFWREETAFFFLYFHYEIIFYCAFNFKVTLMKI